MNFIVIDRAAESRILLDEGAIRDALLDEGLEALRRLVVVEYVFIVVASVGEILEFGLIEQLCDIADAKVVVGTVKLCDQSKLQRSNTPRTIQAFARLLSSVDRL